MTLGNNGPSWLLCPADRSERFEKAATSDHVLDLQALARTDYTTVMLARTESAEQVSALAPLEVVALIETPLGALTVVESSHVDNTVAVMWGAEDLLAVTGGTSSRCGPTVPTGTSPCTSTPGRCWPPRSPSTPPRSRWSATVTGPPTNRSTGPIAAWTRRAMNAASSSSRA